MSRYDTTHPGGRRRCRRIGGDASSERGSVLVLVAFLAVLVGMLSLSMMTLLTADTEEVFNHLRSTEALTIAETGIEHALKMLRSNAGWDTGFSDYAFPVGSSSTYSVTVDDSDYPTLELVSTGQAGGFERQLQVSVVVVGPPESAPYPIRIDAWREL